MRKCKACSEAFSPVRSLQVVCSPLCAIKFAKKAKARKEAVACREERKANREARERVKTRGDHLRELQASFNAWIRLRDLHQPCISCGRLPSWQGQWDAGHYRSRGSEPALRFEPDNVHKQCLPCNRHLSGNLIAYRVNLIEKIGLERVEWLEGHHEAKKLTVPELQEMKAKFRAQFREMKKAITNELEPA